jgi:hypothetical protein
MLQALVVNERATSRAVAAKERTNKGSSCGLSQFIAQFFALSCGKIVVSEGNPTHEI